MGMTTFIDTDCNENQMVTVEKTTLRLFRILENTMNLEKEAVFEDNDSIFTNVKFIDQESFVTTDIQGKLVIYDIKFNKKFEKIFQVPIKSICVSNSDNSKIYCGCSDGYLRILSINNSYNVEETEIFAHNFGISSLVSNNEYIITTGYDSKANLYEIGKENKNMSDEEFFDSGVGENKLKLIKTFEYEKPVLCVSISPSNIFNIVCFAVASGSELFIYRKLVQDFKNQIINFDEEIQTISFSSAAFAISVGFKDKFKAFAPNEDDVYEEVEVLEEQ